MIKQTFITGAAILAFTLGSTPVWAEEVDCTVTPEAAICLDQSEAGIMPINETDETMSIGDDEVITDTEVIEEETEPALWPMYLSLGALGLAIVVFIILNLFGSKKKK